MAASGIEELDQLLGGGYPVPSAILFEGPIDSAKERILYDFIGSATASDSCIFVTKSGVEEVIKDAKGVGLDASKDIIWVAGGGGKAKSDLENLATFSHSLKDILYGNKGCRLRIVLDIISPMLMTNSPENVYRFVDQLISEIKRYDAVMLATLDDRMHGQQVVAAIEHIFDGVISVEPAQDGARSSLRIKRMKGVSGVVGKELFAATLPSAKTPPRPVARNIMPKERVAVLPLSNFSPDPNDEYFADGMTEELISTISGIPEISVISRTSTQKYKGVGKTVGEIGNELNAGTIIEGSVRKSGNRFRITVQLVEAQSDKHLWAESYEKEIEDVFEIQTDIARSVASTLKVKLLGGSAEQILKRAPSSPDAYTLYLRGLYQRGVLERTQEDWRKAIDCFERAIEIDPNYALAYAGLADCYEGLGQDFQDPREVYPRARELAEKSIALDNSLPEAHSSLAVILYRYYWDRQNSEREFKKALDLNPSSADTHRRYSDFLLTGLRFDLCLAELNRSIELDPLSVDARLDRGRLSCLSGKYDDAIAECNQILDVDRGKLSAYEWISIAYARKSMFNEALTAADKLLPLYNGTIAKAIQARIYYALGKSQSVRNILDDLIEDSEIEYVSPVILAVVYKLAGDDDNALAMLNKAYEIHSPHLIYLNSHQFYFEILGPDARINSLRAKVGLAGSE